MPRGGEGGYGDGGGTEARTKKSRPGGGGLALGVGIALAYLAPSTLSFRAFSGEAFTTLRAGLALIMIVSPVAGLRPSRAGVAGRSTVRSLTSPGMVNTPG